MNEEPSLLVKYNEADITTHGMLLTSRARQVIGLVADNPSQKDQITGAFGRVQNEFLEKYDLFGGIEAARRGAFGERSFYAGAADAALETVDAFGRAVIDEPGWLEGSRLEELDAHWEPIDYTKMFTNYMAKVDLKQMESLPAQVKWHRYNAEERAGGADYVGGIGSVLSAVHSAMRNVLERRVGEAYDFGRVREPDLKQYVVLGFIALSGQVTRHNAVVSVEKGGFSPRLLPVFQEVFAGEEYIERDESDYIRLTYMGAQRLRYIWQQKRAKEVQCEW